MAPTERQKELERGLAKHEAFLLCRASRCLRIYFAHYFPRQTSNIARLFPSFLPIPTSQMQTPAGNAL